MIVFTYSGFTRIIVLEPLNIFSFFYVYSLLMACLYRYLFLVLEMVLGHPGHQFCYQLRRGKHSKNSWANMIRSEYLQLNLMIQTNLNSSMMNLFVPNPNIFCKVTAAKVEKAFSSLALRLQNWDLRKVDHHSLRNIFLLHYERKEMIRPVVKKRVPRNRVTRH